MTNALYPTALELAEAYCAYHDLVRYQPGSIAEAEADLRLRKARAAFINAQALAELAATVKP